MKFEYFLIALLSFVLFSNAFALSIPSNILNSSVAKQTTTIPIEYRAVVAIILIIIVIYGIFKFFKIFIAFIFIVLILTILLSTAYYFFTTGTFSIQNSLAFLEYIWKFFTTASSTIHAISNVSNTITSTANII